MSKLKDMPVVTVEQVVRFRKQALDTIAQLQAENKELNEENAEMEGYLGRYRREVPLGHQPHMLAGAIDAFLEDKS